MAQLDKKRMQNNSRSGVALVIVLGFLSILMVLAVSFLIQVRVERILADYTLGTFQLRNLTRTALADGMNTYSRMLWNQQSGSSDQFVLPPERMMVFLSGDDPQAANVDSIGTANRLLIGEAKKWVPGAYWPANNNPIDDVTKDAYWIYVTATNTGADGRVREGIIGRYAYACFDMSGGLDANLLGLDGLSLANAVTSRFNIREFSASAMSAVPEISDPKSLNSSYREYLGFDTLYEMVENARGVDTNDLNHLVPYSMSAFRGTVYDSGSGEWTQPKPCFQIDWVDELDRLPAYANSQFTGLNIGTVRQALRDYTSTDVYPAGVDYPSPKNVPMFNELRMTLSFTMDNWHTNTAGNPVADYFLDIELDFEFWCPFPSSDNATVQGTFRLNVPAFGLGSGEFQFNSFRLTIPGTNPVSANFSYVSSSEAPGTQINVPYLPRMKPYTLSVPLQYRYQLFNPIGVQLPGPTSASDVVALQAPLSLKVPIVLEHSSGRRADQLGSSGMELSLVPSATRLISGAAATIRTYEVSDPRLNHLSHAWHDTESVDSLLEINSSAIDAMKNNLGVSSPGEVDFAMYCRNGTILDATELGYIPLMDDATDADAWKTVDLYTLEGAYLLRKALSPAEETYFTNNTHYVFYTNGTINPNTSLPDVLGAAFTDVPVEAVPNWNEGERDVRKEDAFEIADRIVSATETKEYSDIPAHEKGFTAGTDWAAAMAPAYFGYNKAVRDLFFDQLELSKSQRESLISRTWGLFRPEDSLFTILTISQAIKQETPSTQFNANTDMVVGERRAAALIWRDPFPLGGSGGSINPHHEMSTVIYQVLTE